MADRIAEIDAKIVKKQDEIAKLKEQRKELTDAKKNELAIQIARLADEKGITLDELFDLVRNK